MCVCLIYNVLHTKTLWSYFIHVNKATRKQSNSIYDDAHAATAIACSSSTGERC